MFLSYFISELHAIYLFLGFREGFYFAHGYHADQEAMSQLTIIEETHTKLCSSSHYQQEEPALPNLTFCRGFQEPDQVVSINS